MPAAGSGTDDDLARRVYAYFIFRLRQPADAERLTRLAFERFRREQSLKGKTAGEPDLLVFGAVRAVIAENPRPSGVARVARPHAGADSGGSEEARAALSEELQLAIGRLHGRERDALALRFGAELSVGEIAELLDRTPADVKQRLARGVRLLVELGVLPTEGDSGKSAAKRSRPRGSKGR